MCRDDLDLIHAVLQYEESARTVTLSAALLTGILSHPCFRFTVCPSKFSPSCDGELLGSILVANGEFIGTLV